MSLSHVYYIKNSNFNYEFFSVYVSLCLYFKIIDGINHSPYCGIYAAFILLTHKTDQIELQD